MEDKKKILSTEETENNIEEKEPKDTLDSLLLDADDDDSSEEEQDIQFDVFMAEYRDIINKNLSNAANAKKTEVKEVVEAEEEDESEFLISLPKKQPIKKAKKTESNNSDWNEDITLEPEEYTDPLDDGDPLINEEPVEEVFEPDFDLGEVTEEKEDKFQLSINFEGESMDQSQEQEENKSKYDPDKPRKIDWVFDIAEIFVFVLVVVTILTSIFFRHSIVEGSSMNNTLENGDHLIISDLFYTPERGDIIVFEDYSTSLKKAVVKRVIGIPGDTVEIRLNEEGRVIAIVNGEQIPDEYALNTKDTELDISSFNKPITLGDDEIFVMGDNRYHSLDSRSPIVGPIHTDAVLGKVLFRFFPFDKFGTIE